jgi:serine protease SohB
LRERFGDKVVTPLIAAERGFLGRRVFGVGRSDMAQGGLAQMGLAQLGLAEDIISALEARAIWARYGL